jgi:signal transduction histidine kinase
VLIAPREALAQVLANLVRNACEADEAASERDGVCLSVDLDDGMRLRVSDRGPGFDRAVLARLGQPFVTGRPARGGLGLGLYLAYGFAARRGGGLEVHDRPGGGSIVTLRLPTAAARRASP